PAVFRSRDGARGDRCGINDLSRSRSRRRVLGLYSGGSMGDLWTIDDMAAAMAARRSRGLPEAVGGIAIDSRTIKHGEAVFAVKGDAHDGHDFVAAALRAKAGVAVVSNRKRAGVGSDAPLLVVRDVLTGLRKLAAAARARSSAQIIAVTGSVGKTSTKEALN